MPEMKSPMTTSRRSRLSRNGGRSGVSRGRGIRLASGYSRAAERRLRDMSNVTSFWHGALWEAVAPLAEHPACGEVRGGVGLMAAVDLSPELTEDAPDAAHHFHEAIRDAGVIVRGQATGVAIGPPLTI